MFFFLPQSNPSPLIFSVCRDQAPIRYSALTHIFLDNTTAWRKKVYAFINSVFCWNKEILSYSSFLCYSSIGLHLPCVSRWVCDAALWQQTLVYSSCSVWDAATLGASISSTAFTYSLCCHVKWRGCVACLYHAFSISSTACFTWSAVWDPPNWCIYQHTVTWQWKKCDVMQRW